MKVRIPVESPSGAGSILLEGLWHPPEGRDKYAACVICHPHPMFGGSMHNNVVYSLHEELSNAGFGTLCFNFRGVGGSQGRYDEGRGEVDDVKGALDFLQSDGSVNSVFLAGYSFGGLMALYASASGAEISGLALVSPMPPLKGFSHDPLLSPFAEGNTPFIVVYGTSDDFCPVSAVEDINRFTGGRGRLFAIEGADHFYGGIEDEMAHAVLEFFSGLVI